MNEPINDYEDLIDLDKVDPRLAPIAELIIHSDKRNWDKPYTPFQLFLDLIGWTLDEFGELIFDPTKHSIIFGYTELHLISLALNCYTERPDDVKTYIHKVLEAEYYA